MSTRRPDKPIRLTARRTTPGDAPAGHDSAATTASRAASGWRARLIFDGSTSPGKNLLFLLLTAAWIIPGLIGHEPWKPDEAYTFGVVYDFLKRGDWLVPSLAGEPFLDKPPLFYLIAALCASLTKSLLPLHDGARLAAGVCMLVVVLCTSLTSRALFGPRNTRITVLILLGTLGLVLRAHLLLADICALAAFSLGCYGLAVGRSRHVLGGMLLGSGAGAGFLCTGLFVPAALALVGCLLPFLSSEFRTGRFAACAAIAALCAAPWLLIWPWLLYQRSPALFSEWLHGESWERVFGVSGQGFGKQNLYFFSILPWYGWPALPLACWALWQRGRSGLARPEIILPLSLFGVVLAIISYAGVDREVHGLPLLIPLAVLAGAGVDSLRRGAAAALDWFGMMSFGLISLGLWVAWLAMLGGFPEVIVRWVQAQQPAYRFSYSLASFVIALAMSLVYFASVLRAHRTNRRAVVNWTAGITVFWMLAMTLWLPLIDVGKGYRDVVLELRAVLPQKYDCVSSRGLAEAQRAMLDYYAGIVSRRSEIGAGAECHYFLQQGPPALTPQPGAQWKLVWSGSRPGDTGERFWLFRRGH